MPNSLKLDWLNVRIKTERLNVYWCQ